MSYYIEKAKKLVLSCILFSISIIFNKIKKLSILNYFIFNTTYLIIFYFNQGTDFFRHGTYNCIFFLFLCPFCLFYLYVFYLLFYFLYHKKIKKMFFIIFFFLIHVYVYLFFFKCDNFYNGLDGIKIDNNPNENACSIVKPKRCGLDFFDGIFDASKIFNRQSCEGYSNQQSIFQKYLAESKKNKKKYSFPRTENFDIKGSYCELVDFVEKYIEVVDSNNSKNNEIFLNFENGKGQIEINLKKDLNLIKSRKVLSEKNLVNFNNIYIIYIDGISRNHFLRKFKKTSKLIENMLYSKKNKEEKYKKYNSFQFLKYHVMDGNTQGNNFPFVYGNYMNKETGISMTKFFKEKGFITASTFNSCNRELFDWSEFQFQKLIFTGWDHENFALFCDNNFVDKDKKWSIFKGKNSIVRKCLYGKDSFEYEFEYILQFLEAYKNERKFFKIGFADAHEGTMEVVKYIDDSLANFLEIIFEKYYDNKTAIIFLSDHGCQIPGFQNIFFNKEKHIETYLAMLFFILPEDNNYYNKTAININQQRFVTPFDIHDTLLDMININKKKYPEMIDKGQSLFKEIDGLKRNCENYDNRINKNVCYCKKNN